MVPPVAGRTSVHMRGVESLNISMAHYRDPSEYVSSTVGLSLIRERDERNMLARGRCSVTISPKSKAPY
jgi:hypothetical protein